MPHVRKLEALKEVIKEAYQNGGTIKNLASTYGVAVGTIRDTLKRQGVTLRSPGRRKK